MSCCESFDRKMLAVELVEMLSDHGFEAMEFYVNRGRRTEGTIQIQERVFVFVFPGRAYVVTRDDQDRFQPRPSRFNLSDLLRDLTTVGVRRKERSRR